MQRRVDRYLAREIVPPFFVAILAFLVFIGLELVISLSDTVFARGAGAAELLRLVLHKLPTLFTYAIPAATLLATFLALGRLAADRELLAFQALGYSLRRLTLPFLMFGALASGVSFTLGEFAVPSAEAAYRRELLALLYRGAIPQVQEAVFFRGLHGETYYVERAEGDRLQGILVYDLTGRIYPVEGRFPTVITAHEGRFQGGTLELTGGRVLRFAPDGGLTELVRFERLTVEAGEDLRRAVLGGKTAAEMSLRELGERIELLRRSGLDPRSLVVEYHSKIAVAVAAFVFVLFGAPLGALLGRRGRAAGAIAGFLLAAAAQGMFVWARTMAQRGVIPAYLGAWLPHLGFGLLGFLLFITLDRLRLRGLLPFLFLLVLVGDLQVAAVPPFSDLRADELVVADGATTLEGRGVRAEFGEYVLEAETLHAREETGGWVIEAEGALLSTSDGELRAARLSARLGPGGELGTVTAHGFSGKSTFRGPEKVETILFSGERGEAQFAAGELARVEAYGVRFTTCPCFPSAPYAVEAQEFVLLPKRWLYARSIVVTSFGIPVGWLPFYVARLGEEASPLFPQIGRVGENWFLRWAIPWTFGEGMAGAVGLTWYPGTGQLDPSLQTTWEDGTLALTPTSLRLQVAGRWAPGPWRAGLDLSPTARAADLSGEAWGWGWSVSWGRTEREEKVYERLPEVSLTRVEKGWLGGNLTFRVSGGIFKEEGTAGWRLGLNLAWSRAWQLGPFSVTTPWQTTFAQYPAEERITLSFSPGLAVGGFSLAYGGRWQIGRSPFQFDADPPQSQITVAFSARMEGWQQRISWGWDLTAGGPLPLKWSVSRSDFACDLMFASPLALDRSRWSLTVKSGPGLLTMEGGLRGSPWQWEDTLVKGHWSGDRFSVFAGARVGMAPLDLARLALSLAWDVVPDWTFSAAIEYDARTGHLVQLEGSAFRSFSGCLRIGVAAGLRGIRFMIEVPAFPQAKIRFAPLDEGLRLGE
ncbi:MAG: LptF/LptG family permease [Candidatus Bipolaricaulota bacterium]